MWPIVGLSTLFQIEFCIFRFNLHNNIAQKLVESKFYFLCFLFLSEILMMKNKLKLGFFLGFWPFSQKDFIMGPWNIFHRHIRGTFRYVWSIAPGGHIFGPFFTLNRTKMRRKVSFSSILQNISNGFMCHGAQIFCGILYMFANIGLIFVFIIHRGHMVTFNTRSLFIPTADMIY